MHTKPTFTIVHTHAHHGSRYDDGDLPRWLRSGDPSDTTHGLYGIPIVTRAELVTHFENGTVREIVPHSS